MTSATPSLRLTQAELAVLATFSGTSSAARTSAILGLDALAANPDVVQAGYGSLLARDLAVTSASGPTLSDRANAVAVAFAEADDWLFASFAHADERSGLVVIGSPRVTLTLDVGAYGVHETVAMTTDRDALAFLTDRLEPLTYDRNSPAIVAIRRVPADSADPERFANLVVADADAWALPMTSMFTATGTSTEIIASLRQALGYHN